MPLCRLVYVSLAREAALADQPALGMLLRQARRNNLEAGITGVLAGIGPAFIHALEGQRDTVTSLFDRIYRDPRHTHVEIVDCSAIRTREFGDWTLAYHRLDEHDAAILRRFGSHGRIDPLGLAPDALRALLLATMRQSEKAAADRAGFAQPALA